MELSLCMIVKDEEKRLSTCLESVKDVVDEIVIADTGSTDATKEIAARYTERTLDVPWADDFAAARNASMEAATKPFILWLDADDVIDPPECEKLMALKARLSEEVDAVMMPYHYAFSADGRPSLVFDRERIVRRAAGFRFAGAVHEAMAVHGNVIREEIAVRHTGSHAESSNRRNLAIYRRLLARGAKMTARDWYYYARELKNAGEYEAAVNAFDAFLTMDGWIENRLDAYIRKGECHLALGDAQKAKAAYLAAMTHGAPRAEALCAMGECLLSAGDLPAAAFWYRAALQCDLPKDHRAFVFPDAYGYVPLMQLCVIYDRMGDPVRASRMNEQALLLHPGDAGALSNRAYFARRLEK
ncbi:MAG: glycosyltransferase [Clostridia bacterium]|nr:glycosyltransferase [Clostridia bacterium]